ncbi:MAG: hypothetical protein V4631_15835 [Pseudomonadota bacterium]
MRLYLIMVSLHSKKMKKVGGKQPGNVSMAPLLELILLIVLAAIAFFDSDNRWSPVEVLIYGACAVVASYGACAMIGKLCQKLGN